MIATVWVIGIGSRPPARVSLRRVQTADAALKPLLPRPSPSYNMLVIRRMNRSMPTIPVMRPKLPVAQRLVAYLRRIDGSRVYSNFAPLACSLEDRLAEHYGLGTGTVTTVANATLGLALSLSVQGAKPGTLCAMPAWTFVASAHAAVNAGLIPYFVDVDPESWSLDAHAVIDEIAHAPAPVGAVMPVAPFGRPLDVSAWDAFRARTGVPVVIDAAAGFDALT